MKVHRLLLMGQDSPRWRSSSQVKLFQQGEHLQWFLQMVHNHGYKWFIIMEFLPSKLLTVVINKGIAKPSLIFALQITWLGWSPAGEPESRILTQRMAVTFRSDISCWCHGFTGHPGLLSSMVYVDPFPAVLRYPAVKSHPSKPRFCGRMMLGRDSEATVTQCDNWSTHTNLQ